MLVDLCKQASYHFQVNPKKERFRILEKNVGSQHSDGVHSVHTKLANFHNQLTVWPSISCIHTQMDHSESTLQFKDSKSPANIGFNFKFLDTVSNGHFFHLENIELKV